MLLGKVRQMVLYSLTRPSQILQAQDLKASSPNPDGMKKIVQIKQGKNTGLFWSIPN